MSRYDYSVYKDMAEWGLSTGGFRYRIPRYRINTLLGTEGKGSMPVLEGFNVARVVVAAALFGRRRKCIEIAADYAKHAEGLRALIIQVQGISS